MPLVPYDPASRLEVAKEHSEVLRITISVFISRLSLYFALQSILPVALCTLLSLMCFFLGASRVSTRLELTFSLFLTLAAINFVIGEGLPKTSSVLPSQVLILFSYSFLFAVAAESLVVYHVEIFPELRAEWRERAVAREAAKRELSRAVTSSGRRLVKSISSLGRGGGGGGGAGGAGGAGGGGRSFSSSSAAVAAAAASNESNNNNNNNNNSNIARRRSSKEATAGADPSLASPTSPERREFRSLRSIRFSSSDVELGSLSASKKKTTTATKKDGDEGEEKEEEDQKRAKGAKAAASSSAFAPVAPGDHDGGEHHEGRRRRGDLPKGRRNQSDEEDEEEGKALSVDPAEREKFRFAAHFLDRLSFWVLLVGYVLAVVLIFALSSALAPGECAQFAQQSLVDECRLARRTAEERRRLGGAG